MLGALSTPRAVGQAKFTTIYTFDGAEANGLTAGNGVLYAGSSAGTCGSIIALYPPAAPGGPWTEVTLYSFTDLNGDGCGPVGAPAVGSSGTLYGVTEGGGLRIGHSL